jgi:hypothetical protein
MEDRLALIEKEFFRNSSDDGTGRTPDSETTRKDLFLYISDSLPLGSHHLNSVLSPIYLFAFAAFISREPTSTCALDSRKPRREGNLKFSRGWRQRHTGNNYKAPGIGPVNNLCRLVTRNSFIIRLNYSSS